MEAQQIAEVLAARIKRLRASKRTLYGAELHLAEMRRIGEVYDIGALLGVAKIVEALEPYDPEGDHALGPEDYET
jgi:hypothetical protein